MVGHCRSSSQISHIPAHNLVSTSIPILRMGKIRLQRVKRLAFGHTASESPGILLAGLSETCRVRDLPQPVQPHATHQLGKESPFPHKVGSLGVQNHNQGPGSEIVELRWVRAGPVAGLTVTSLGLNLQGKPLSASVGHS